MPAAVIHPSAVIDASVTVEDGAEVGPFAVISGDVIVGRGAKIGAHCVIGATPKVKGFSPMRARSASNRSSAPRFSAGVSFVIIRS